MLFETFKLYMHASHILHLVAKRQFASTLTALLWRSDSVLHKFMSLSILYPLGRLVLTFRNKLCVLKFQKKWCSVCCFNLIVGAAWLQLHWFLSAFRSVPVGEIWSSCSFCTLQMFSEVCRDGSWRSTSRHSLRRVAFSLTRSSHAKI